MAERRQPRRPGLWFAWLAAAAALAAWLADTMYSGEDKTVFLPGRTTDGHHQIELACGACHVGSYTDRDAMQTACESCHLAQLKAAKDDHPKSKFTDPRNADRVARLDARYCVTCHVEHRPDITLAMGVTQPADYCFVCHEDIGEDRPSHQDMAFDTCASAGCHNFHDNRALYEDFLLKHAEAPAMRPRAKRTGAPNLDEIVLAGIGYPADAYPWTALTAADVDAPPGQREPRAVGDWAGSAHAAAGANCSACHGPAGDWEARPDRDACGRCHVPEAESFVLGRHGMRQDHAALGVALPPMAVADARLPMQATARGRELTCNSCHAAHDYDVARAATESCLGCHADEHSLAFETSAHATTEPPMTCATCHMPMQDRDVLDGAMSWTFADHHQSRNLRPNEKMIRPVCQRCHGLGFAIDALADTALVARNFDGQPAAHHPGIGMAVARLKAIRAARAAARTGASTAP